MDSLMKSKNKESTKSDPSKGAGNKEKDPYDDDYIYDSSLNMGAGREERQRFMERTVFVVDLSRLKLEHDTLEGALVMYSPEREFKKQQYEQRCSQLVGLSLCTSNLTGKYPEFLRLKGTGYAIRGLGEHYIMGLSSRIEEPPAYCVNYLKLIHDLFCFYYHSPSAVLKSVSEEWEKFTERMYYYLSGIISYILRDQHSVPAMLNPLPYFKTLKKSAPRNFLLASRILRSCQQHSSIVAGCILFNNYLVMSQLPPDFTEKLLLVGRDAISLKDMSVLGDNIAPDKVWVLEIFLTLEECSTVADCIKDHTTYKNAYDSLGRASNSGVSMLQSTTSPTRSKGQWRRQTNKNDQSPSRSSTSSSSGSGSLTPHPPHDTPHSSNKPNAPTPVTTSTPNKGKDEVDKGAAKKEKSEDTIVISPGLSSVFFDKGSPENKNRNSSSSSRLDGDESEYVDAVETMDPTMGITKQAAEIVHPPSPPKQIPKRAEDSDVVFEDARPGSVSSEVFATPSPSPPREVAPPTENDDTLTRGQFLAKDPASLTTEELTKLINTPVFVDPPDKSTPEISSIKSTTKTPAMALPPSWRFKATPDSDDENDFVDSEVLQAMLKPIQKQTVEDDDFVDTEDVEVMVQDSIQKRNSHRPAPNSTPPPLPPRNQVSRMLPRPLPPQRESPIQPPPLPPRNYLQTTSIEEPEIPATQPQHSQPHHRSIYDTMNRGTTVIRIKDPKGLLPEDSDEEGQSLSDETANEVKDEESTPVPTLEVTSQEDSTDLVPSSVDVDESEQAQAKGTVEQTSSVEQKESTEQSIDIYGDSPRLSKSRKMYDTDITTVPNGGLAVSQDMDDSMVRSKTSTGSHTDAVESSFECIDDIPDGMVTPPGEMSYVSESVAKGAAMKLKMLRNKVRAPTLPPRKIKRTKGSDAERSDTDDESSGSESFEGLEDARGQWLPTMKRPTSANSSGSSISKRCLYIQQYMGTLIILLGREDLHNNHHVLNSLWRPLLHQLMELDNTLRRDSPHVRERRDMNEPRPASSIVTYSSLDRHCEAYPLTTAYHFRHALRRVHQEYVKDPSLVQNSLSKEHLRVLSQSVHKREVYIQPSRLGHLDVLAMHGAVEKYAKTKNSARQQPPGGPKMMFV